MNTQEASRKSRIGLNIVAAVAIAAASNASANDSCDALFLGLNKFDSTTSCGVIGAAGIGYESAYTNEAESVVAPFVTVVWESFYLDGAEAGYLLWNDLSLHSYSLLTPFIRISDNGYDASEEAQLLGLEDTNEVAEAGVRFSYGGKFGEVQLAVAYDVSSEHESFVADAAYAIGWEVYGAQVAVSLGVEYLSEDASNYYYGINADQVSNFRALYSLESALNFEAGYFVEKPLTDTWSVFHFGSVNALDSDIKDSPIVMNDSGYGFGLGVTYTF